MKRTVELDDVEIADKLNDLSKKAAVIAAAVTSLRDLHPDVVTGIERMAWDLHDSIDSISEQVHPEQEEPNAAEDTAETESAA